MHENIIIVVSFNDNSWNGDTEIFIEHFANNVQDCSILLLLQASMVHV